MAPPLAAVRDGVAAGCGKGVGRRWRGGEVREGGGKDGGGKEGTDMAMVAYRFQIWAGAGREWDIFTYVSCL